MSDRISWSRGWRGIVLILIGGVMGANLIAPAVAHVGGTINHLWGAPGHIKAKVKSYGDGRWAKKTTSTRMGSTNTEAISSLLSTDGEQVVASVSVTVPGTAKQLVEVTGNFMVWDFSNSECPCEVDYYLAEQGSPSSGQNVAFAVVQNASLDGTPATATTTFTATPGTHTYELRAQSFSNSTNPLIVNYARMTAKTVPFTGTGSVPLRLGGPTRQGSASGPASER